MKGINLQGNEWRQHSLVTPIPPLCVNKIHCLAALWYLQRFQVPRNPIEIRYPGYLVPLVNTSMLPDNDFIHPCRLILSKCTDALGHKVLPPSPTDIKYQWGHFGTFEIRSLKFNLFRRGIYPHVFHEKCPRRKYSISKSDSGWHATKKSWPKISVHMKGINLQGNEWRQHSLVTLIPPLCVNKIIVWRNWGVY